MPAVEPPDKPYGFVPLLNKCKSSSPIPHHTIVCKDMRLFSGKLRLSLVVRSPVHIGDGTKSFERNDKNVPLTQQTMREAGRFMIPGSTVKGVVRGIAEAVSYACAVTPPRYNERDYLPETNKNPHKNADALCPTCSMFGIAKGKAIYRGKIRFGGFKCEENVAPIRQVIASLESPYENKQLYLTPNENGQLQRFLGRKFYKTNAHGYPMNSDPKKIAIMALPTGTILKGEITFQGLTKRELSLLAFSLGLDGSLLIPMGYAKANGHGRITMKLDAVEDYLSQFGQPPEKDLTVNGIIMLAAKYFEESDKDIQEAVVALRQLIGMKLVPEEAISDGAV